MKEIIITSALGQFLSFGIRKVTIQQITYPLGLSTKAVYKYFSSKEELLEECLNMHYHALFLRYGVAETKNENPILQLFDFFTNLIELDFKTSPLFYYDLNHYYPELQDKVIQKDGKRFERLLENLIRTGKEEGYIQQRISASVAVETLVIVYTAITRTNNYSRHNLSPFEIADNTIGVFFRGICTPKGLSIINDNELLTTFANVKPLN